MRTLLLLFITFVLTLNGNIGVCAPSATKIYKKDAPSVVQIITIEQDKSIGQGSGFAITPHIICTCQHVVKGAIVLRVYQDKRYWEVPVSHVVTPDSKKDISFIWIPEITFNPLETNVAIPEIGEICYTLGCPMGYWCYFSQGMFTGMRHAPYGYGDDLYLMTTAVACPGSSGGAFLDKHGKLLGMTVSQLSNHEVFAGCIPSSELLSSLEKAKKYFCISTK